LSRRLLILLSVLALAIGVLAPMSVASAAETDGAQLGTESPSVAKSKTGSYIVVMEADPLVVTEGQDALNTPKVKKKGKALAKGHDKVLEDAGASADDKVHSFTNALKYRVFTSYHTSPVEICAHIGLL